MGSESSKRLREGDLRHLERCLELAALGRFGVSPNPMVGAVLVGSDGRTLGEGYHRLSGGPHAEIEALRAAGSAGEETQGATAFVSLEPCCFHGKTPPCTEALLEAGVDRVVAIHRDPNPRVAGGGFRQLEEAGVEVAWLDPSHLLVTEALKLNWRFLVQQNARRTAVTLKWAMSLDGRIATCTGQSQWISSPEGREWALELREEHDAILVGSGTALADDPRLTRRLALCPERAEESILRVVLDRRLRLPESARMLTEVGPIVVYTAKDSTRAARAATLRAAGAEVVILDDPSPAAVLRDLHQRGVQSLLVEGGAEILGAFAADGAFDRVSVCCAPLLIGGAGAPGPVGGRGFEVLGQAPRLTPFSLESRGPDVVLTSFRDQCLRDLYESVAD